MRSKIISQLSGSMTCKATGLPTLKFENTRWAGNPICRNTPLVVSCCVTDYLDTHILYCFPFIFFILFVVFCIAVCLFSCLCRQGGVSSRWTECMQQPSWSVILHACSIGVCQVTCIRQVPTHDVLLEIVKEDSNPTQHIEEDPHAVKHG